MNDRTLQDLLAERRANVKEWMHETDPMARAMLVAHVAEIDAELERRNPYPYARMPAVHPSHPVASTTRSRCSLMRE